MHAIFKKIYFKGLPWFVARLLQEAENGETFFRKLFKPIMLGFFYTVMFPINKLKAKNNIENSKRNHTLYFFYDLEVSPVTFDFAWALAIAVMYQKKHGFKKIQVIFVPGKHFGLRAEASDYEACVDSYARHWRKSEILFSMCNMILECGGVTFCATREEAYFLCEKMRPNIFPRRYSTTFPITHSTNQLLASSSPDTMVFHATKQAKRYVKQWLEDRQKNRKLITITLRTSSYMPVRNNNLRAWADFAKKADNQDYFIVFVPDTDASLGKVPEELEGLTFFHEPAWNLNLRAALYELSYLNLGVNNGAMILCWLNEKCRYITFKMLVDAAPQTQEIAFKKQGFHIDQSLPFAKPYQKWVWEDDNTSVIEREFNTMCRFLEKYDESLV